MIGPFDIYEFDNATPIVIIEQVGASAVFSERAQTRLYREITGLVKAQAMNEADSLELLRKSAQ